MLPEAPLVSLEGLCASCRQSPEPLSPQIPSLACDMRAFLLSEKANLLIFLTGTYLGRGSSEIQLDTRNTFETKV